VYQPSDGVVVEDLTYPGDDGRPVEAFLVRPAAKAPQRCAGLLAWHWFDTQAPDGDRSQFLDEADELAHAGVVSLLPQGRFPWHEAPVRAADDLARIRAEVRRLRRGLDLLAAHPVVDADRLAVVGHDFGGMLAAVAAAEETRLRSVTLVAATPRWGDWFLPFWPIEDDRLDYLAALRPVDPIERIGEAGPAEVLFQFGRQDFFIAPMTGLEFHGSAPEGSQLLPYDDDHGMRRPEIRADRRAFLTRTLELPTTGPSG